MAFQIFVRSQDYPYSPSPSQVFVQLPQTINLSKPYEVCLTGGNFPNVDPNVSAAIGNNIFRYYDGTTWHNITIPDGAYNATSFMDSITPSLIANENLTPNTSGVYTFPINIYSNRYSDRMYITLQANYELDLTNTALATLFGFTPQILIAPASPSISTFTATNISVITQNSNYYMIYTDLIKGGVLVGSRFPNGVLQAAPGGDLGTYVVLGSTFGKFIFYPLRSQTITNFTITIYNGNDQVADLRGEQTFFELTFRPISSYNSLSLA